MTIINVETLLQPITPDAPCGQESLDVSVYTAYKELEDLVKPSQPKMVGPDEAENTILVPSPPRADAHLGGAGAA